METELSRLVDTLPGLVWTAFPDGQFDFLNRRWCEYTGLSVEAACGWGWLIAIHSEDRPELLDRWRSVRTRGVADQFAARLRRFDGEYRWFLFRACPLADASGQLVKWCGINSDIEDQRQAGSALKRSEARKTAILESALDCIVTIDHEGCITEFNPAAERTFGYREGEVVGKQLADVIVPPSLRERHRQGFARYLATGEAHVIGRHVELTAVRADGSEFPVELAITRIPSDGPPAFTGYLRDITERKRSEELLRRSKVYLEHAQKLSHTGSFGFRLSDGQLFWSEETANIYGYDPTIPPTMEMLLQRAHPDDVGFLTERFGQATQGGASFDFEHRLLMADGSIKHVRSFAHSVNDEAGNEEILGAVMDITEQHQTEADLQDVLRKVQESETEFRTIIEGVPTLAWSTGADGNAEFFSQRWLDYSGMSKDEVQGQSWMRALHPDDFGMFSAQWTKIIASEKSGEVEARLRRFDGEYRWFLFRAAPFADHCGKVVKWYGTNTDIDDLKRAETLLAGEKRLLEIIAKGESLPATLSNLCLFVEELCPRCTCCSILMLDSETKRLWHAASPSVPKQYTTAIDGFVIGPDVSSCGTAAFHRRQTVASDIATDPRWAAFRDIALANGLRACWSTPIFSSEHAVLGTFAMFARVPSAPTTREQEVIEQITHLATIAIERTHGEEALRRSRAYMAEAQKLSCTGSFGWNVSTKKIFWSEESFRIFGYEPTCTPTIELIIDRVHPDDVALVRAVISQASHDGKDWEVGHRLLMPNGEVKHVHVAARAAKDEIGNIEFVGALVDVTEPTQAEEDLRQSEAALRKAQAELAHVTRVTTMGELAASIAHEVNQPIAGVVINGNACLRWLSRVQEDSVSLTEARETLQRIIRDGNRAGEIIGRIRALFKNAEPAKEPLDLNETIREVIVLASSEMDKQQVALRLELSADLPNVLGDRVQLQQVMLNLILNAIDAMATVEGRARDLVIQTQSREEREVVVTVWDSGIGLHPENVEHVFTAFHTTKPGGLGMGLSISRSIVENHAGRLWVTAHEGPGASFHFALPTVLRAER